MPKSNEDHSETIGSTMPGAVTSPASPGVSSYGAGRYEVKHLLGEGGQKRVYLAYDKRLERDVVIAVLKVGDIDHEGTARFHREAKTLARLGDHPHIVTVFDIGEEEGQTYLVAQFVEGGTLHALRRSSPGYRLPITDVLRIGTQICQALHYAHQRGIVHRDLKPGNVWLTNDGTIKLGDFGLAVGLSLSRVSLEGVLLGTVAYMAPEQATGRFAEPRGDLYSLGVLLYELVTGRLPFVGDTIAAIISQHLHAAPVAPSWHVPAIPPALDALILKLLAKTPEDRPANAEEVQRALTSISSETGELEIEPPKYVSPLDRLAAGVFVGRLSELQKLRRVFDESLDGRGNVILVAGEPGSGKTATADQLLTYAHVRGAHVLRAHCHEGEGAPAYWPWVQLIRSYVTHRTPDELLSVMGAGAAAIAQLDGEIERHLPELPDLPSLAPEQARFRLFDSITMFLKNASSVKPIVLFLDDLHWADPPSLLLLQFLSKELPTTRLLVIGTYRDLTLDRRHPLRHLLAGLAGDGLDHRIELKGLGESDVARFIEMTTGAMPPPRLASAVYRETEGNPFFVKEVVRLLVATGQLDRVDETSTWTVTLPEGVREVVIRRLAQVSSSCNRLLEIAAVMGREFELSAVEQLAGLGHSLLVETIEEAIAARLITELSATPALYRFSHALIRETIYEGLSALKRARLHLQVGELLISTHGESSDAPLEALAHHFFQAISLGQADKAVLYATRAGERADRLLAYEDAVSHYEMALRALDLKSGVVQGQRGELLLSLGEVQMKAGLGDLAYETFERAATWARQHGAVEALARAALDIGAGTAARTRLGREVDDVQIGLLREALSHSNTLSNSIQARLLSQLSLALYHSPPDRLVLSERAVAVARGSGDSAARLASLYSRCLALEGFNRADERLALATELVQEAERAGDAEMALRGHYRCLRELLELADLGGVERELATYSRLANELRQPRYLWYVPFCRASLDCANGRLDEAERLLTEALSIGQRAQDVNATLFCTVLRNAVLWLAGRFDESELLIKSLVGKYPVIQSWRAQLARLYCFMGRLEDARREFEHLAQNDFDDLIIDGSFVSILSQLCTVSWFLGDARRAEQLYGRLEPYGERIIVAGNTAISGGAASFGLGMAASANCRWETAEQRFRHAIDKTAQIEAWSWLGLTKCGYAWMLSARQQPGDREHVATLHHEVQAVSRQLNMSWLTSWFPNASS